MLTSTYRPLILLLLVGAGAAFLMSDARQFLTLETLKASHAHWAMFYAAHPWVCRAFFMAGALVFFSLPLPGGSLLLLAAGSIFGWLVGFIIIVITAMGGACIAFLCSRLLIGEYVQRRFAAQLMQVNRGIADEGALYVFALHLIPFIPFGIINWVMGITPLRLHVFACASLLGLLPGIALITAAGTQLASIHSLSDIFSPALLLSLCAIGVLPVAARRFLQYLRQRSA
ncbi:MAG: VTT domain-containing protein [Pseudomonadota bacterium]